MASRCRARGCWRAARRGRAALPAAADERAGPPQHARTADHLHAALLRALGPLLRGASAPSDSEAERQIRSTLASFEIIRRGMNSCGRDNGLRPVHLVLLASTFERLVEELPLSQPALAQRLAELIILAANRFLVEFHSARVLVLAILRSREVSPALAQRLSAYVVPSPPWASSPLANGFRAHCLAPRTAEAAELRRLTQSLLRKGVAVSHAGLPEPSILLAAEVEARALHEAGQLHQSTVKQQRETKNVLRYEDPSRRGDLIRWMDGSDASTPALSCLTQWLRTELMGVVREALCASSAGDHCGCAASLQLESPRGLPLAMLACYPAERNRFQRHLDNDARSPDRRAVTAVLYLNHAWRPQDEGLLRIYGKGAATQVGAKRNEVGEDFVDVEPRSGTLVMFWSHRVEHEVMPTNSARYALSLWMCVAEDQPQGWMLPRKER